MAAGIARTHPLRILWGAAAALVAATFKLWRSVPVNVGCQQPLEVVCEPVTLVPARRRKVLATARA